MLTPYPADRLHNQHPPPPARNKADSPAVQDSGGQFWTPIPRLRGQICTPQHTEALIAGSIDEVAAQFDSLGGLGYTDVIVRHLTNDQPKVLGSLERLQKVRAALG